MSNTETNFGNSEMKTKSLYRRIAYCSWGLLFFFFVIWMFNGVSGNKVYYGLIFLSLLGTVFTVLTASKKILGENINSAPSTD